MECQSPERERRVESTQSLTLRALIRPLFHKRIYSPTAGESTMNRLKDKVAVVTGGGEGIGRATCELFAEEGAAVIIAERNPQTGKDAAESIQRKGGKALFVQTDVSDEPMVQRMVSEGVRQ